MSATSRPCDACLLKGETVPATHYETTERRFVFCGAHALPWDAPLAPRHTTVAIVVRAPSWPGGRLEALGY